MSQLNTHNEPHQNGFILISTQIKLYNYENKDMRVRLISYTSLLFLPSEIIGKSRRTGSLILKIMGITCPHTQSLRIAYLLSRKGTSLSKQFPSEHLLFCSRVIFLAYFHGIQFPETCIKGKSFATQSTTDFLVRCLWW